MRIHFFKYHGTGNDFILVDCRAFAFSPSVINIAGMCNRHTGIGADGLMLLTNVDGYDFGMIYFNADGRESTMCGNGGRCITAFASSLTGSDHFRFMAADGVHEGSILEAAHPDYRVKLTMSDVQGGIEYPDGLFINTGSPHFIRMERDVAGMDVMTEGRKLRNDKRFAPGGTNVDFVEVQQHSILVRTYERGVEAETLSCGTGVTASALAVALTKKASGSPLHIETPGGALTVHFERHDNQFSNIVLEGPARFVFEGYIDIG